jgi:NADH:ubiquinone oxidoreductase subunit C
MSADVQAAGGSTRSPEDLGAYVRDKLGARVLDVEVAYGQLTVDLEPAALVDAARLCKDDETLGFDFWEFNSGVDLGEEGFALVTHLYSVRHRHHINLRIVCPGGREKPTAPTLTGLYAGADWSEREAYDMFGITFEGHPHLLPRILTVENFEGWPLRKDFLLSTREAKPWPGAKEPAEAKDADEDTGESAAVTPSTEPKSGEDKAAAAKAKAERAKAKAAEARAKKARERAEAEGTAEAEGGKPEEAATATGEPAEPEAEDARAAAPAAAGDDVPAGTPDPSSPEGAAEVAGSDIAKDAAAGAVGGDVAAGAPGDQPDSDQPVEDLEQEAKQGEGGAPAASGSPGIEAEGRHAGADEQSGDKPAAETPGMTAEPAGGAGAPVQSEAPAPGPGSDDPGAGATAAGTDDDTEDVGVEPLADSVDLPEDEPSTGSTRPAGRAGSSRGAEEPDTAADTGEGAGSGTDASDRGGPVYDEPEGPQEGGRT